MQTPASGTSQVGEVDLELEHKIKKATEKISENLHIIANEPSLAFYRLQEHVRKSMPQLVEKKLEMIGIHQQLQGACYDTEYDINAVRSMHGSTAHFQNIQDLLKSAMFMKQQIVYEQIRRAEMKSHPSMYQRVVSHDSLSLPEVSQPPTSPESTK